MSNNVDAKATILLEGFEVQIDIGIHEFEKQGKQRVLVDVELHLANGVISAAASDRINDVLDYDFVTDGIKEIAELKHWNLQETLADAILSHVLSPEQVAGAVVTTRKPDVYPNARSIGLRLEKWK